MKVETLPFVGPMQADQKISTAETSLVDRTFAAYRYGVKQVVDYLVENGWFAPGVILGTFLLEPWSNFKASCLFLLGYSKNFQWYGLNPDKLTPEQAKKRPMLLLHGNFHNQSAWIMMAKALQKADGAPIFTVNLYSGDFNAKDRPIIEAKIEVIKQLYRKMGIDNIEIDIMGHSRGATMAFYTALENDCWEIDQEGGIGVIADQVKWRKEIGNIIRLGTPTTAYQSQWLNAAMRNRIYEIDGVYDCLVDARSKADTKHKAEIKCGHLALLFHQLTAEQVALWRKQWQVKC